MKRRQKARAKKRTPPCVLLGKRLVIGKPVHLGGGLYAELESIRFPGERRRGYIVSVTLRTRGAGDLWLTMPRLLRESPDVAAESIREVLTHFASALRLSGAN